MPNSSPSCERPTVHHTAVISPAAQRFDRMLEVLFTAQQASSSNPSQEAVSATMAAGVLCSSTIDAETVAQQLPELQANIRRLALPGIDDASALLVAGIILSEECPFASFAQDVEQIASELTKVGLPVTGDIGLRVILCARSVGSDLMSMRRLSSHLLERLPWSQGAEELPVIALMTAPGIPTMAVQEFEDRIYRQLRGRGFVPGLPLLATSALLSRAGPSEQASVERFLVLSRMLDAVGHWPFFPPAVALLSLSHSSLDAVIRSLDAEIRQHPLPQRLSLSTPFANCLHAWLASRALDPANVDYDLATFLVITGVADASADR
jgi:hypothetical protein